MSQHSTRRVTANLCLTLDGRYNGPGGAHDLGAILPYATTEVARRQLGRIWETATTAVLGRRNAEGFLGYWPMVAADATADPRDRAYANWLVATEKLVFSSTLGAAPWPNSRLVQGVAAEVIADLQRQGTGDILVNSSASLIKALLSADLIDRLYLMICPEIAGGGERLFDDGLPASRWVRSLQENGERGEMAMVYDRLR